MGFQLQTVHKTVIKVIISIDWQEVDSCTCDGTRKLRKLHEPHTTRLWNNFPKLKSNTGETCVRVPPTASTAEIRNQKISLVSCIAHGEKARTIENDAVYFQRRKKDPKTWILFHFIFRFIFINHIQRSGCCRNSHFKKRNTGTRSAAPYAHTQAHVRAWNAYNRRCVCDDGCRQKQRCHIRIDTIIAMVF